MQAVAAGMAEGFITADFIAMSYQNTMQGYCDNEKEYCDRLNQYLADNMDWVQSQIKKNPYDSYWHQVWYNKRRE